MDISELTDDELWNRTRSLAQSERASSCDMVEHLAEVDRRSLHIDRNYASMFEYCTYYLGLSEEAAYRRIRVARAIRKLPAILELLREDKLTIENVALLHPYLDDPDAATLVKKCIGLRKWQVQNILAGRTPQAVQRDVVRICGPVQTASPAPTESTAPLLDFAAQAMIVMPTPSVPKTESPPPPNTIRVSFSADEEFHRLMLRAKAVLRHKYPDGRLEGVLKDALVALLKKRDRGFRWV